MSFQCPRGGRISRREILLSVVLLVLAAMHLSKDDRFVYMQFFVSRAVRVDAAIALDRAIFASGVSLQTGVDWGSP